MKPITYNYNYKELLRALNPSDIRGILTEKALKLFLEGKLIRLNDFINQVVNLVNNNFPEKIGYTVYYIRHKDLLQITTGQHTTVGADIDSIHVGMVIPVDIDKDPLLISLAMTEVVAEHVRRSNAVIEFELKKLS